MSQSTSLDCSTSSASSTCTPSSTCTSNTSICPSTQTSCSSTQTSCSSTETSCSSTQTCSTSSDSSSSDCSCSTDSSSTCTESEYSNVSSTNGCSYTENCTVLGKKKYIVTFEKKCDHPLEHEIVGKNVIYVNNHQTPVLKMTRGYTYYFYVKQHCDENTFVLTQNPAGYVNGIAPKPLAGSFDPVSHGCVKYHVNQCTPKYFYYQSSTTGFIGGLIVVQDE